MAPPRGTAERNSLCGNRHPSTTVLWRRPWVNEYVPHHAATIRWGNQVIPYSVYSMVLGVTRLPQVAICRGSSRRRTGRAFIPLFSLRTRQFRFVPCSPRCPTRPDDAGRNERRESGKECYKLLGYQHSRGIFILWETSAQLRASLPQTVPGGHPRLLWHRQGGRGARESRRFRLKRRGAGACRG